MLPSESINQFHTHQERPTDDMWKAEEAVPGASSDLHTSVGGENQRSCRRPGGMERPGDDFKATHNVTIKPRDTTFGGQISRLQVAEVVGTSIARTELAENKARPLLRHVAASCMHMRNAAPLKPNTLLLQSAPP